MYMPFVSHFCKIYLSLSQQYLIRFHRKESSRLKEPQIKSLPNADNSCLKQIPCTFATDIIDIGVCPELWKTRKMEKFKAPTNSKLNSYSLILPRCYCGQDEDK